MRFFNMVNIKERIKKELEIQEKIEGINPDKKIILKILDYINSSNELRTFVYCYFYQYGKYSYQVHRFYKLQPNVKNLLNDLIEKKGE